MIKEGGKAPAFKLDGIDPEGNEKTFTLSALLKEGRSIVLYFYPMDNTPGCTEEACDFRDNMGRLSGKATVLGVSPDSIESHRGFSEKHGLSFALLSDPGHEVIEEYGAWGEKTMYGKKSMGVVRTTVIITPDGKIKRIWSKVQVKGHVEEVMGEI